MAASNSVKESELRNEKCRKIDNIQRSPMSPAALSNDEFTSLGMIVFSVEQLFQPACTYRF